MWSKETYQFVYIFFWGPVDQVITLPNAFRLTKSDFREPVNIGSDEMVSMNEMAEIVLSFENKQLPIHHIPGPEGVRGRNSDNTLIKEKLGWAPTMRLKVLLSLIFRQPSVYQFIAPNSCILIIHRKLDSCGAGWSEDHILLDQGAAREGEGRGRRLVGLRVIQGSADSGAGAAWIPPCCWWKGVSSHPGQETGIIMI